MKKGIGLLLGLLLIINIGVYSQVNVSFDASVTQDCAPVNITFTNTSTGCTGTESFYWLSGTGDDATLENPVFSYTTGGVYTVSLTVTCDGTPYTETMEITIFDPPTADFDETPQQGCNPYTGSFTDLSTEGDGDMNWQWYFGDGTSSSNQNPTHPYNTAGNFNISLVVTDENGCVDQHTSNAMVSVANPPVISFTADKPSWCQPNHDVEFTANVLTSFGLEYTLEWDFGDGSGPGSGSPVIHTYLADGLYDVSLTVTDDYGCESTVTYNDFVQIATATADYSVLEGDIVCKNQDVHFQNETGYSCRWDFGDGSPVSSLNTPVHVYNTAGDMTVTFTVDPDGPCEVSTNFTLTVEQVTASFTTDPANLYSCTVPFEVDFTSTTSSNVTGYFWVFQDGGTSNLQNPTHEYTAAGVYQPALTVTTDNNCSYTYIGPLITLNVPDVSITADPTEGCEPLEVEFTYTGTTPVSSIVNYSWDFDNGNTEPNGGSVENQTFNAGEYTVTLTITDNNGCVGFGTVDFVVGSPPSPIFDIFEYDEDENIIPLIDNTVCAQDVLAFYIEDYETLIDLGYEFTWLINDSEENEPDGEYYDYEFEQYIDEWIDVTLVSVYNGCESEQFYGSFYVEGPIIDGIVPVTSCLDLLTYTFTLNHQGAEIWDWEFYYMDGASEVIVESELGSSNTEYTITFPTQNVYYCRVTATNSSTDCEFEEEITVSVLDAPQAIFALIDDEICADNMIVLNGGLSQNVSEYYWDFGDGTNSGWITESAVQNMWTSVGYFTITLTVRDGNGCEHSITDEIHILGPEIDISVDNDFGCGSLLVTFTDASVADETISQVVWDFNNGDQLTGAEVQYLFDEVGTYSVYVHVTTISGCDGDSTYTDLITIADVNTNVTAPIQIACVGDEITFNASETDPTYTYTWNFGEGGNVVGNNPTETHEYSAGGKYDVYLHIDNLLGCTDDITLNDFIIIQEPIADFSLLDNSLPCYPVEPQIIQNSSVVPAETNLTYQWIMGNNDTVNVADPEYLFTTPGTFNIVLNIETPVGCSDTHTETLTIDGPYADVYISDTAACVGQEVEFSLSNMESVDEFEWVVGGGDSYTLESFTHTYSGVPPEGFYPVTLTLRSGTCIVPNVYNIYIYDPVAGILITDPDAIEITDGACSPFDALLTSDSEGATTYTWYVDGDLYGTGLTSEPISFENNESTDQTVTISLAIADTHGCYDSISTTIDVFALPEINIHNDTIICYGDVLGIYATGGTNYNWSPNIAISDVNSPTPNVNPTENQLYTVEVFNEHLCMSKDSIFIVVMQEPEIILTPEIDTIMIGDTVFSLLVADQENLTYTWSPDTAISCLDCPMPFFNPEESTRYNLVVEDSLQCFRHNYYLDIVVLEEYSLDVPMAFTPLGNDGNKVVYVKGFGIKKLLQFRIYNRWGEEVFYTDDINQGWNGYYKGQLQNIDNYSYYVEAEMYDGTIRNKKGHIMLIR